MRSPVLFLIFNRPNQTALVFETIKNQKPPRLYIVADGPREGKKGEIDICSATREIVNAVDWNCQVKTLFRKNNLGCKKSVSQGISWFFEHETEGIILEDDCLPSPSFFDFMDEMLEKFRYEEKVACINGNCSFNISERSTETYFFTVHANVWGWGTWKRVWDLYDLDMTKWPEAKKLHLTEQIFFDHRISNFWNKIFQKTYEGKLSTWDYQLVFLVFFYRLLCVQPYVNLISNIGFGPNATITKDTSSPRANQKSEAIDFPIKHPTELIRSFVIEEWDAKHNFGLTNKIKRLIKKVFF